MFKSILVATDGSDHARKALQLASDVAGLYGASLSILHVTMRSQVQAEVKRWAEVEHLVESTPPKHAELRNIPSMQELLNENTDTAIDRIREIVGEQLLAQEKQVALDRGAKEVGTLVVNGDPVTEILNTAERQKSDLIILGSRGLSPVKGVFLGSVSNRVSQAATCTCVTVK